MDEIRAYLVCVYSVVDEGPTNPSGIQGETNTPISDTRDRRPTEECSPIECKSCTFIQDSEDGKQFSVRGKRTQYSLRPVRYALHKWVNCHHG